MRKVTVPVAGVNTDVTKSHVTSAIAYADCWAAVSVCAEVFDTQQTGESNTVDG